MVIAGACDSFPKTRIELDWRRLHESMTKDDRRLELHSVLNFFWDEGIPVLPLSDSGAFHGACWRTAGRNVIVVKQRSRFMSRWVFDLLHEWHHAGQFPEDDSYGWI